MNARFLLLSAAAAAVVAAGVYHWRTTSARSRLEAERAGVLLDVAETRRLAGETSRQVAVARGELQALVDQHTKGSRSAHSPSGQSTPANEPPKPRPPVARVQPN